MAEEAGKYWLFLNNQVLGPYAPDDLGRLGTFSSESLVCPEGRKGTSMGDWQRAGMVADLSLALVQAAARQPARAGGGALMGLPPEPTLKDLAVIGGLQEKVSMLESVAAQLQDGLRAKEEELSALRAEEESRRREGAERSQSLARQEREAADLRRRVAELEERLTGVKALEEALEKASRAERALESDVSRHAKDLEALAREMEALRREGAPRPPAAAFAAAPAPSPAPAPLLPTPLSEQRFPEPVPLLSPAAKAPFEIDLPASPRAPDFPPVPEAAAPPAGSPEGGLSSPEPLASAPSFEAPAAPAEGEQVLPQPPAPDAKAKRRRLLLAASAAALLLAAGGGAWLFLAPASMPAAPPPPAEPESPEAAAPAPAPAPRDPRQEAVELVKAWTLPSGRTLAEVLAKAAPASGSLSPWMAEKLSDGRVQVNYFASSAAPGAPTVAYEFVADLAAGTVSARNAAAKAALADAIPAPPRPKPMPPVKVRPKPRAPAAAAAGEASSLPPLPGLPEKPREASPAGSPGNPAAPSAKPAKAAAKPAPAGKAGDEALLDDILKE